VSIGVQFQTLKKEVV